MNSVELGTILTSSNDPGAWFVFYADDDGCAAIDLTTVHPDFGYKRFEAVLTFEDTRPEIEKIVLLGGPERPDDALFILHETLASGPGAVAIDGDFSFMAYTYVLIPGQAPGVVTPDNRPAQITLKPNSRFLIAIGHRIFTNAELERDSWRALPTTADTVFGTPRQAVRQKVLGVLN